MEKGNATIAYIWLYATGLKKIGLQWKWNIRLFVLPFVLAVELLDNKNPHKIMECCFTTLIINFIVSIFFYFQWKTNIQLDFAIAKIEFWLSGPYTGGWGGRCVCGGGGEGGCGVHWHPLVGQIISKSCKFSPETEFTHQILASKSEFSEDSYALCKTP